MELWKPTKIKRVEISLDKYKYFGQFIKGTWKEIQPETFHYFKSESGFNHISVKESTNKEIIFKRLDNKERSGIFTFQT